MTVSDWSFRDCCPDHDGGLVVVAGQDSLTNANVPVSFILHWSHGKWAQERLPFIANTIASCDASPGMAWVVGPQGHCARWLRGAVAASRIDPTAEGPQNYGDVTGIECIDGDFFVTGMSRTAYRSTENGWIRIDHDTRTDDEDSDAGFTAISGFHSSEFYALGWDGEIWWNDNAAWHQVASPTNIIFHDAVAGSDGMIYACGQAGTIVRGRRNTWEPLELGAANEDFRGITEFKGSIFVCSTKSLYRINPSDPELVNLVPSIQEFVSISPDFYALSSDGSRLWSTGRRCIITTTDAVIWERLPDPPG
jgi:hypothetical protein